jgi:propanediol dehydratase small subunit
MTWRAVSRYAFISIDESTLDFGTAIVGSSIASKSVTIMNRSDVTALVQIQHKIPDTVNTPSASASLQSSPQLGSNASPASQVAFSISNERLSIEPYGKKVLQVSFNPFDTMRISEHFELQTVGGNTTKLTCHGNVEWSAVRLSASEVTFEDTAVGLRSSQQVQIHNDSPTKVKFDFRLGDRSGTFQIAPCNGVLPPNCVRSVTISFLPLHPINYFKCTYCVFDKQAPVSLDLIGTSFNEQMRPAPLASKHIAMHRWRVDQNAAVASPEDIKSQGLFMDEKLTDQYTSVVQQAQSPKVESYLAYLQRDGGDSSRSIASIQQSELNFGATTPLRASEYQIVTVTNHTNAKIVCAWDLPMPAAQHANGSASIDDISGLPQPDSASRSSSASSSTSSTARSWKKSNFVVFPAKQDIAANSSVQFKVAFRPPHPNEFYHQQLECTCYFKTNRSFRLVDEHAFVPPQNLKIVAKGHTFSSNLQQFVPECKITPSAVNFAPCVAGERRYQTLTLCNQSDTPFSFSFVDPSASTDVFRIKPLSGVVHAHELEMVVVEFMPTAHKTFQHLLQCVLNNSAEDSLVIPLVGAATGPRILLADPANEYKSLVTVDTDAKHNSPEADQCVYFKPTCRGLASYRQLLLRNNSGVPVNFEWSVPSKHSSVLSFEPACGQLHPYEVLACSASFVPDMLGTVNAKPVCLFEAAESPFALRTADTLNGTRKVSMRLAGECIEGAVQIHPSIVDFGVIPVGRPVTQYFQLTNSSESQLSYELSLQGLTELSSLPAVARFDEPTGLIQAHCTIRVGITCVVDAAANADFSIICLLSNGNNGAAPAGECEARCNIAGWFPQVRVTDVRCTDTPVLESWKQTNADELNSALAHPLNQHEFDAIARDSPIEEQQIGVDDTASSVTSGYRVDSTSSPAARPVAVSCLKAEDELNKFDATRIDFSPTCAGDGKQCIHMQLTNMSPIDTKFHIKFPDELAANIESWDDVDDITQQELRTQAIIDNDLFVIEPRTSTIAPNASVTITLNYDPQFTGMYDLPVLVDIQYGKKVVWHLYAETHASWGPSPSLLPHQTSVALSEVPLGISRSDVPVQSSRLWNNSAQPLAFKVDEKSLGDIAAEAYGFPVLQCLSSSGIVAAESFAVIQWQFTPIEDREYSNMRVCILTQPLDSANADYIDQVSSLDWDESSSVDCVWFDVSGAVRHQTDDISLNGDPHMLTHDYSADANADANADAMSESAISVRDFIDISNLSVRNVSMPHQQKLNLDGQLGVLSHERVRFGTVQTGESGSDVITVFNLHPEESITFQFDTSSMESNGISVYPSSGVIERQGSAVIHVKWNPRVSRVLDELIKCLILPQHSDGSAIKNSSSAVSSMNPATPAAAPGEILLAGSETTCGNATVIKTQRVVAREQRKTALVQRRLEVIQRGTTLYLQLCGQAWTSAALQIMGLAHNSTDVPLSDKHSGAAKTAELPSYAQLIARTESMDGDTALVDTKSGLSHSTSGSPIAEKQNQEQTTAIRSMMKDTLIGLVEEAVQDEFSVSQQPRQVVIMEEN